MQERSSSQKQPLHSDLAKSPTHRRAFPGKGTFYREYDDASSQQPIGLAAGICQRLFLGAHGKEKGNSCTTPHLQQHGGGWPHMAMLPTAAAPPNHDRVRISWQETPPRWQDCAYLGSHNSVIVILKQCNYST